MNLDPVQHAHRQAAALAAIAFCLAAAAAVVAFRRRVVPRAALAFLGAVGGGLVATAATLFANAHDRGVYAGGGGPILLAFGLGCLIGPALGAALASAPAKIWPWVCAGPACLAFATVTFFQSPLADSNVPPAGPLFLAVGVAGMAALCALVAALASEPGAAAPPPWRAWAIAALGIAGVAATWNLEYVPRKRGAPPRLDLSDLVRAAGRSGGKVRFVCAVPPGRDVNAARDCLARLGSPLVALGGRLFSATLPAERVAELSSCRDLSSAHVVPPEEKLDPELRQLDGGAGHVGALFFDDVTDAEADAALSRAGAKRLGPTFNHGVPIAIAPDQLRALAAENVVWRIEHHVAPTIAGH